MDVFEIDIPSSQFGSMGSEIRFPLPERIVGGLERLRLTVETPTPSLPPETASETASLTSVARSSDNSREESDAEGVPRRRGSAGPKRTR